MWPFTRLLNLHIVSLCYGFTIATVIIDNSYLFRGFLAAETLVKIER